MPQITPEPRPEPRSKHEIKTCPRCGLSFECKLNNPVHCGCARVHLSDDLLLRIQEQYPDCLCTACLTALVALGVGAALDLPGASQVATRP
jgi:hypothetical protein